MLMNSRPDCCYRLGIVVFAILPLSALSCVARAATSTLTLVRDGQPAATIVVAQSAGHIPWFAAGELQYHVRKITGATLPIVTDDAEVHGTRILVGASRQTESLLGLRNGDFKPQEYLIGFRPDTLVLMGRDRENDAFPVRVTGPLSRVEGKFGQALEFTGAQAVSVSSHGFSDEAGTLEAWVYLGDERPDAGTVFRLDGNPWTYHIVDLQGGALRYVVYDGKSGRSVTSAKLANGWHHLCASHDGRAGKIELFVDGASCGTAAYTGTSCSNAPALLMAPFSPMASRATPFVVGWTKSGSRAPRIRPLRIGPRSSAPATRTRWCGCPSTNPSDRRANSVVVRAPPRHRRSTRP